jgi:hypothetical protein
VERTLSVVATCRQQGRNVLEYRSRSQGGVAVDHS